jgi:hypothetical protein
VSLGTQIFSALDQLTNSQRNMVAAIWDEHARLAPGARRLNNPRHVLLRFDLLARLYEEGVNSFRVFGATDLGAVRRFPVFVRHRHAHNGPLTGLLNTRGDVARGLCALGLRGHRFCDLMIAEFCDTSGPDGLFRKYAAFKVGNSILPSHVMVSHRWSVKSASNESDEALIREGIQYIESHPHDEWLRRVFAIAGTDYGRVDYGVLNGVPQVWEINLNPTIGRASGAQRRPMDPALHVLRQHGRELFHSRLRAAFVTLDDEAGESQRDVTIPSALLARLRTEEARGARRRRVLNHLRGVYDHPQLGLPVRAVYARLFPRR